MEKRSENKDMNVKGHNDSHGGKNKNKISHKLSRKYLNKLRFCIYLKSRDKSLKQSTETMQFYILWNFVGTPKKKKMEAFHF